MSIRKTGITLWRGSGFLLRTLKKEQELFCPSLFLRMKKTLRTNQRRAPLIIQLKNVAVTQSLVPHPLHLQAEFFVASHRLIAAKSHHLMA